MQSKMNLSFSIFLMLMLTQVALSVPVDKNVARAQSADVELYNQKLSDLMKELTQSVKNLEEEIKNVLKQALPGVHAKVEDFVKHINSPETKKKIQDFLEQLSKLTPAEFLEKFGEKIKNLVKEGLTRIQDKLNALINQINSAETKKKLQELLDELNRQNEKIAEELKKLMEKELPAIKTKAEEALKHMNSPEVQKKMQALIDQIPMLSPAEIYDKIAEILKNFPKQIGGKN